MEELLSGFLISVILTGCWCTWAPAEDALIPLLVYLFYWHLFKKKKAPCDTM